MNHSLQRRDVVLRSNVRIQLEEPNEHRRHHLTVRHAVFLYSCQVLLRIEMLHHHSRAANALRSHGESQRRSVVHGCGTEIDARIREAEQHSQHGSNSGRSLVENLLHERLGDSFGLTRRTRGVEHVETSDSIGERLRRLAADCVFVALIAGDRPVQHQAETDMGSVGNDLSGLICLVLRRDEGFRAAVVDDVGKLLTRESRRGCCVDDSSEMATPQNLQVAVVILQTQGYVISGLQANAPQELGKAVRRIVQLFERLRVTGTCHHQGSLVRRR